MTTDQHSKTEGIDVDAGAFKVLPLCYALQAAFRVKKQRDVKDSGDLP